MQKYAPPASSYSATSPAPNWYGYRGTRTYSTWDNNSILDAVGNVAKVLLAQELLQCSKVAYHGVSRKFCAIFCSELQILYQTAKLFSCSQKLFLHLIQGLLHISIQLHNEFRKCKDTLFFGPSFMLSNVPVSSSSIWCWDPLACQTSRFGWEKSELCDSSSIT